jgi:GNAT superfamily N-acetyltransferase
MVVRDLATRALQWSHEAQAAVCDVIEPWAHGTVLRATRYPRYFDFNVVRVEQDPRMTVDELVAFSDEALAGLDHRRIDFDRAEAAEPLKDGFEARGWLAFRLLLMRHEQPPPDGPAIAVEEVPYDAVRDLRAAWHEEDFPGLDDSGHYAEAREVARRRGASVLAVAERGTPIAFAQLERHRGAAEVAQVYVRPEYRGEGRGTAVTRAAIEAAGDVRDLWITADADGRPKELYARLGFRPAVTTLQLLRLPRR